MKVFLISPLVFIASLISAFCFSLETQARGFGLAKVNSYTNIVPPSVPGALAGISTALVRDTSIALNATTAAKAYSILFPYGLTDDIAAQLLGNILGQISQEAGNTQQAAATLNNLTTEQLGVLLLALQFAGKIDPKLAKGVYPKSAFLEMFNGTNPKMTAEKNLNVIKRFFYAYSKSLLTEFKTDKFNKVDTGIKILGYFVNFYGDNSDALVALKRTGAMALMNKNLLLEDRTIYIKTSDTDVPEKDAVAGALSTLLNGCQEANSALPAGGGGRG